MTAASLLVEEASKEELLICGRSAARSETCVLIDCRKTFDPAAREILN